MAAYKVRSASQFPISFLLGCCFDFVYLFSVGMVFSSVLIFADLVLEKYLSLVQRGFQTPVLAYKILSIGRFAPLDLDDPWDH